MSCYGTRAVSKGANTFDCAVCEEGPGSTSILESRDRMKGPRQGHDGVETSCRRRTNGLCDHKFPSSLRYEPLVVDAHLPRPPARADGGGGVVYVGFRSAIAASSSPEQAYSYNDQKTVQLACAPSAGSDAVISRRTRRSDGGEDRVPSDAQPEMR